MEVVSEGNTAGEMAQKRSEYFESGSRLVWFVYPKSRTIVVFEAPGADAGRTLGEGDVLDGGTVLPGFSIPVTEVFEPLTFGL